jgi:acyl-CoA synthetase (AMP-forming)/AMP-acid ligase II
MAIIDFYDPGRALLTKPALVMAAKSVDFTASLPRSPVGRVLKKDLRQPYRENSARNS